MLPSLSHGCATDVPPPRRGRSGFTLIEVVGALLIFAMGVLMVIQLSDVLQRQMNWAARSSEIVVVAHQRLDSLETLTLDSLSVGVLRDTVTLAGLPYQRTSTVTALSALLYQIDVSLAPVTSGTGPSYTATSYVAERW